MTWGAWLIVLGAAAEHDVRLAGEDLLGGADDGLEARAAQAVEGERGHRDRHAGAQADVAGEVDGVVAGLEHVAVDDLIEGVGGDVAAFAACTPRSVALRSLSSAGEEVSPIRQKTGSSMGHCPPVAFSMASP
jgi:hypothetical protein